MTHTTRPVRAVAVAVTGRPRREAPRYPALKPERYRELDAGEKRRADLHGSIDVICDAAPRARLDRDSVGFPGSCRQTDGSRSTETVTAANDDQAEDEAKLNSVEAASQRSEYARPWLMQLTRLCAEVVRVERTARLNWPEPLAAGTVISQDGEAVTVLGRSNSVGKCAWCGDPAESGRHATGKTKVSMIGDHVVHANAPHGAPNCYMSAYRQAAKEGTTIAAVLAVRVAERRSA